MCLRNVKQKQKLTVKLDNVTYSKQNKITFWVLNQTCLAFTKETQTIN